MLLVICHLQYISGQESLNSLWKCKDETSKTHSDLKFAVRNVILHIFKHVQGICFISTSSYITKQIKQMAELCLQHGAVLGRVCGIVDAPLQHRNLTANFQWHLNLTHAFSTEIHVTHFQILNSVRCGINKLVILHYFMKTISECFCGHLPPWRQIYKGPHVRLQLSISWPFDNVLFSLIYNAESTRKYVLYREVTADWMNQALCDAASDLQVTTHVHIRIIFTISFIVNISDVPLEAKKQTRQSCIHAFDGPGINSQEMHTRLSSSHQLHLTFSSVSSSCKESISMTCIKAPQLLHKSGTIYNSSDEMMYHTIQMREFTMSKMNQVNLELTFLWIEGFKGRGCEYGDVLVHRFTKGHKKKGTFKMKMSYVCLAPNIFADRHLTIFDTEKVSLLSYPAYFSLALQLKTHPVTPRVEITPINSPHQHHRLHFLPMYLDVTVQIIPSFIAKLGLIIEDHKTHGLLKSIQQARVDNRLYDEVCYSNFTLTCQKFPYQIVKIATNCPWLEPFLHLNFSRTANRLQIPRSKFCLKFIYLPPKPLLSGMVNIFMMPS